MKLDRRLLLGIILSTLVVFGLLSILIWKLHLSWKIMLVLMVIASFVFLILAVVYRLRTNAGDSTLTERTEVVDTDTALKIIREKFKHDPVNPDFPREMEHRTINMGDDETKDPILMVHCVGLLGDQYLVGMNLKNPGHWTKLPSSKTTDKPANWEINRLARQMSLVAKEEKVEVIETTDPTTLETRQTVRRTKTKSEMEEEQEKEKEGLGE